MEEKLGSKYVIGRSLDFAVSFEESSPATPMFFILSPGVDPLKDVEKHGNAARLFKTFADCKNCQKNKGRYGELARSRVVLFLFLSFSRGVLSKSSAAAPAFPTLIPAAQDYGYGGGIRLTCACFVSRPLSATAADAQQALGRLRDYSKGHEYMRTLRCCVWGRRESKCHWFWTKAWPRTRQSLSLN